eukprot:gene19348-23166_t
MTTTYDDDGSEHRLHHNFSCGIECSHVADIKEEVELAYERGFDFLAVPIAHPRHRRTTDTQQEAFTRSDFLLDSSQWKSVIVAKLSPWIDVDSKCAQTRKSSMLAMRQEISWAAHLAVPALLVPMPSLVAANYAQIIYQNLQALSQMRIWMRVPLVSPTASLDTPVEGSTKDTSNTWHNWNNFRRLCNHHPSLFPVLELTADLPSDDILDLWLGEPVKAIIVPTSTFTTNKAGFPTLSKRHQQFLNKVFLDLMGDSEAFEQPYLDLLQAPLQPLMDNLESQTYEVFEKDPVKYLQYKNAICKALVQRTTKDYVSTVMVVGAGRGPLIKSAIDASIQADRKIIVFAVEKNPNAIVTLKNRIINEGWQDMVTVIQCDMRFWDTAERADIMVSELLGSFGDNELSPECLDGAQRFMKPDGISIPAWYTSYVAPMSSSKLYNEVAMYNDIKHFETPYVVKPHNFCQMATSKPLFTFCHPNVELCDQLLSKTGGSAMSAPGSVDNTRYDTLEFETTVDGMLHGFLGFFDCSDLRGFLDFLELWAQLARKEPVDYKATPNDWSRTPGRFFPGLVKEPIIPPPPFKLLDVPPTGPPAYLLVPSIITRWTLSPSSVEQLKRDFSTTTTGQDNQWISSGDALVVLICGSITRARSAGNIPRLVGRSTLDSQQEVVAMAADGRIRAPQGNMVGGQYFGNFNNLWSAPVSRSDLLTPTVEASSRIALQIRNGINQHLSPQAVANRVEFFETNRSALISWSADIILTNWCMFDLKGPKLDFGFGKPFNATSGGETAYPPGYSILTHDKDSGNYHLMVTVESSGADALRSDPLLSKYSTLNITI